MKPASRIRKFRLNRGRKHRPKPPPCPLTREDYETLGLYNAEKSRGIEHNWVWETRMKQLQDRHDSWMRKVQEGKQ